MARTFRGEGRYKVDAKGRVSIPAEFRRVLQERDPRCQRAEAPEAFPELVLVFGDHLDGHVEGYTAEAAAEVDARIAAMPRGHKARKLLEHLFNAQSQTLIVDETGRIVLSAKIREKLGLSGDAYFKAAGDTFQIWDADRYEATVGANVAEQLAALPEDFDPMALLDDPNAVAL